jgi:hypothetical protein
MQKFMTLLVALTFITSASAAFAASNETEYETKKNGGYEVESTSEVTTPNGTDKSASHKVDVEVDDHGNVKKTVEHTKTVDPKGLMNKTSTTTKTVNGKVVE